MSNNPSKYTILKDGMLVAFVLLFLGLMGTSCDEPEEAVGDLSRIVCTDYCNEKSDCDDQEATHEESDLLRAIPVTDMT